MPKKKRAKIGYMISAVAERFSLHPQTLRLYEREGLLAPSRSEGNTRLYTEDDLERLETILNLTRELGVNLAGIEVILNMREKMEELQEEMEEFVQFVNRELERMRDQAMQERFRTALVRVGPRVGVPSSAQGDDEAEKVKAS
jgi:MerR family transcriptional regulator/heat shock protein HspR